MSSDKSIISMSIFTFEHNSKRIINVSFFGVRKLVVSAKRLNLLKFGS